jgi:chaperonin GroEL
MSGRVLRGPAARAALMRGMHQMTRLLRPTLGPVPRTVAIGRLVGGGPPEVLDNAAIIARRTLGLADPFEDMGAMLVRHLVWRVHERSGDGAATAAVLADGLAQVGIRYLAAGGEPVAMRRGIQRGVDSALEALQRQARPLETPGQITALISGHLSDAELASVLGDAGESVGTDGAILVED